MRDWLSSNFLLAVRYCSDVVVTLVARPLFDTRRGESATAGHPMLNRDRANVARSLDHPGVHEVDRHTDLRHSHMPL